MLELIATLVVDLSDQNLTVYDANQEIVRVIPVSTGKASTPTPTGEAQVLTKYRSVTMGDGAMWLQASRTPCASRRTK